MAELSIDADLRNTLLRAAPGSQVLSCAPLAGGISARATLVELLLADRTLQRLVVRRPTTATREQTLRVVSLEHELLRRCALLGLPAPRPYFVDLEGAALVLEYIEGAPLFAPRDSDPVLQQMAVALARIHRVPAEELPFLPARRSSAERNILRVPEQLDATLDESRLRGWLRQLWPWPQLNRSVLLHGDYWPGNLLWRDGTLAGVLDWEEAKVGDPLFDVAVTRLDLLWVFGEQAMHRFTQMYREHTTLDWSQLPCWDLLVALRPMSQLQRWSSVYADPPICRPDVTEASMRAQHQRFVQQAREALGLLP